MSDFTGDPQVEANKATVRQMLQRLSVGDVAGFTNQLSPNYIRHSQAMPPELQEIRGRDAMHLLTQRTAQGPFEITSCPADFGRRPR